jgi:hypothetical protein
MTKSSPILPSGCAFISCVLFLGPFLGAISACKSKTPAAATRGGSYRPSYNVQGVVRALPKGKKSARPVFIFTQAIPNFRTDQGKEVHLMSMNTPFLLAPGVSLAGYAVGDKVEFTFEVDWQKDIATRITSLSKLPPEHTIDFDREAERPSPAAGSK